MQTFYNGIIDSCRISVDAAAGGSLMSKEPDDAYNLLEALTSNNYQRSNARGNQRKASGMYDVDGINLLNAKIDNLAKMFGNGVNVNAVNDFVSTCDNCGGNHANYECLQVEQANFLSNFNRQQNNNPYSQSYNPGWRNHPNFF